MAHLAIKQHLVAEATGIEKGNVRFNLLNGYLAQKLLFADGLERMWCAQMCSIRVRRARLLLTA